MSAPAGWVERSGAAPEQSAGAVPPPPQNAGFVTHDGEYIGYDPSDPASLEAWFGNFGHAEHFRKVVLASCYEAVRAEYSQRKEPITEKRLEMLSRTHPKYVDWLTYTLNGRHLREQNVLSSADR